MREIAVVNKDNEDKEDNLRDYQQVLDWIDKAMDWLDRTCKTLKAMNNSEDRSKYIEQRISDLKKLDDKKEP